MTGMVLYYIFCLAAVVYPILAKKTLSEYDKEGHCREVPMSPLDFVGLICLPSIAFYIWAWFLRWLF